MVEEKAAGGLSPTLGTLEASGHLRMNKDQYFCVFGALGLYVYLVVLF